MTTKKTRRIRKVRAAKAIAGGRRAKGTGSAEVKSQPPDVIDLLIAAASQVLHLPIDRAWRAGIKFNLQLILRLGALVDEFPLPDAAEPGPVFHA